MVRTLLLAFSVAVCPAAAGAQSFASIFTQLPSDFAHLATPSNLGILAGSGGATLAVHPKDEEIALKAHDPDQLFVAGGVLGNGATHAAAGLGLYLTGRIAHSTSIGELGSDILRAQIVSGVLTDGLKLATNRTRPDGRSYSFPSGHTSSAFATAAVLQRHYGWKAGIPSYLVATYVGSSRMANFNHFATDVVFGIGIGVAAGRAATWQVHGSQVTLAPSLSRHSAGVNLSVH